MKIIEGKWAGKHVKYYDRRGQRVTSEKVRKAVFDILKQYIEIEGASILDLFAGSGLYGFESLSRGAADVTFVDFSREAARCLNETSKYFGISAFVKIVCKRVEQFIKSDTQYYDIIYIDPPYFDFEYKDIKDVANRLKSGGYIVLESATKKINSELTGCELIDERIYGDTKIGFYKKG